MTGGRGRRRKKLLNDLKERRGYSHLKEESLDRAMWRARFRRGVGPVARQTAERMSEYVPLIMCLTQHLFIEIHTLLHVSTIPNHPQAVYNYIKI